PLHPPRDAPKPVDLREKTGPQSARIPSRDQPDGPACHIERRSGKEKPERPAGSPGEGSPTRPARHEATVGKEIEKEQQKCRSGSFHQCKERAPGRRGGGQG